MKIGSWKKLVLALVCSWAFGGAVLAQDIKLPAPNKSGGMPLMEALAKRATCRAFESKELSHEQISSLLWACFGINRPDGKRTAPSAHDQQATGIYVLLKSGAYLYDAAANVLELKVGEDIRRLGGTQDFTSNAPVCLVLVADLAKMGKESREARLRMAGINAGYISQNAYLYCASAGLGTGARMSVDHKALAAKLKLSADQEVIMAHSVGVPKR